MKTYVLVGVGVAAFAVSAVLFSLTEHRVSESASTPVADVPNAGPLRQSLITIQQVQQGLEAQRRAHQELRDVVARLERRLDSLAVPPQDESRSVDDRSVPAPDGSAESALALREVPSGPAQATTTQPESRAQQRERLLAAGFSAQETDEIIRVVDENTLQRLTLRYQAARGGDASRDYRAQLRALPNSRDVVRDQFGEGAYDQYLYATGQPNRVVVNGVLERSPAQEAGLRAGDTLVQFDDQPVYALGDLMRISAGGGEFDQIPLTVLREGELIEVSVPRGPLGINASPESMNPG